MKLEVTTDAKNRDEAFQVINEDLQECSKWLVSACDTQPLSSHEISILRIYLMWKTGFGPEEPNPTD